MGYAISMLATVLNESQCLSLSSQSHKSSLKAPNGKQTDSGAMKLRRPFVERRAKHVAPVASIDNLFIRRFSG
ncbi:MAG: hypothetical protein FWH31_02925 [Streptococcaceae bacterium]|nr:hypothetical protein [Streptococcaceae bacterium]